MCANNCAPAGKLLIFQYNFAAEFSHLEVRTIARIKEPKRLFFFRYMTHISDIADVWKTIWPRRKILCQTVILHIQVIVVISKTKLFEKAHLRQLSGALRPVLSVNVQAILLLAI